VITSNIANVVKRLEKAQKALEPAIDQAMDPKLYEPTLRQLAHKVITDELQIQMASVEVAGGETKDLAATVTTILMSSIRVRVVVDGFEASIAGLSVNDMEKTDEFDANGDPIWETEARQSIVDWIEEGHKNLEPGRDFKADGSQIPNEKLAARLIRKIKQDPDAFFSTSRAGHGALNPTGLAAFAGLVPEIGKVGVASILVAVFEVWLTFIKLQVPENVSMKLKRALADNLGG
jgi:hypothetical protein